MEHAIFSLSTVTACYIGQLCYENACMENTNAVSVTRSFWHSRLQLLKCHRTQWNAVPPPLSNGLMRSPPLIAVGAHHQQKGLNAQSTVHPPLIFHFNHWSTRPTCWDIVIICGYVTGTLFCECSCVL